MNLLVCNALYVAKIETCKPLYVTKLQLSGVWCAFCNKINMWNALCVEKLQFFWCDALVVAKNWNKTKNYIVKFLQNDIAMHESDLNCGKVCL